MDLISLSFACTVPTIDQLNYTRKQPKKDDLTGIWVLDATSLERMRTNGGYDTSIQPGLDLKSDGTFELTRMPDWWDNGFGKSRQGFQDYSGSWDTSTYAKGFWQIDFKSTRGTRSAQLIGQSAPYRIEFVIGDPDSNESMIFQKQ